MTAQIPFLTYSLNHSPDAFGFYNTLSQFTDVVLNKTDEWLPSMEPFMAFISSQKLESVRDSAQYQLELLVLGVYWRNYRGYAHGISRRTVTLCHGLLKARNIVGYKPFVDNLRGVVFTQTLLKESPNAPQSLDMKSIEKLILWLSASGDFKEETKRLERWVSFFKTLSPMAFNQYAQQIERLAQWFEVSAHEVLGKYTENVKRFHKTHITAYANREDIILCGRKESDYHLIMVGSEIMNRSLAPAFSQTQNKIVLLPACMRPQNHQCKGQTNESDLHPELQCVSCNSRCEIGKIRSSGQGKFDVRVIVHASNFTDTLTKWQGQRDVGLVASACVLHLFVGGYEMQSLNIPAQCVFLNYSGCKKHWHPDGVPTALDTEQLLKIVSQPNPRCAPSTSASPTRPLPSEMGY